MFLSLFLLIFLPFFSRPFYADTPGVSGVFADYSDKIVRVEWKKSAGSFTGYQITLLDQKGKALSRTNVSRKTNVKRVVSPVDPASCKVEVRTFEKKAGKKTHFGKAGRSKVYPGVQLINIYAHRGPGGVPLTDTTINYTAVQAERYANTGNHGRPFEAYRGGYLLWINLYTQRLFIFQREGSKWKLKDRIVCSTGRNWGLFGTNYTLAAKLHHFAIGGFIYKWACYFSGMRNAVHSGPIPGDRVNRRPESNGCVRVHENKALWIYDTCPTGTRVIFQ